MRLDRLGSRRVEADFEGGRLVSDGGLVLLRQVDHESGLTRTLSQAIHDPRDPAKIEYDQRAMVAQRVHAIAAGYEDLNDHQTLLSKSSSHQPSAIRRQQRSGCLTADG